MKLDIQEVFFLKNAANNCTIKSADAPIVAEVIGKLDKEFERLSKLEQKKQPSEAMEVAS